MTKDLVWIKIGHPVHPSFFGREIRIEYGRLGVYTQIQGKYLGRYRVINFGGLKEYLQIETPDGQVSVHIDLVRQVEVLTATTQPI